MQLRGRSFFCTLTLALSQAFVTPAGAASPMDAMAFYVGSWSCTGGPPGQSLPPARMTYRLEEGILSQHILISPGGGADAVFAIDTTTAWDAKHSRYVQSGNRTDAHWWASVAKPWTGNTEQWKDIASDAPLTRQTIVRTGRDSYSYTISSPTGKVVFRSTCNRAP